MTRSIKTVAKRIPAAPKEERNTACSHATAIDGIKVTRNKDGEALRNNSLNAAAGHSKTKRLPGNAVPTGDG
jgi:hypothetical protein